MKVIYDVPKRAYINAMELLVAEEVERQIQGLPPRVVKYLNVTEVETYALNRLPALYASSEKGWQHQCEKAKRELGAQIKNTVRQAIAAVQVDPIRNAEPLRLATDESANGVLESLRELFKQPDLSWDGVVNRLRVMVTQRSTPQLQVDYTHGEGSHRPRYHQDSVAQSPVGPSEAPASGEAHPPHWRPGTYGAEVSWQKNHQLNRQAPIFDWNDPRYSK
ncbi:MAG TPA: late competence development ComFB family protein [Leptolyngbyaceae cyanobacterium M65_K2018_010]|nr:late competence development ComFB family protein [Leptolyngbyaceae cyanobacterium M65_K2018_010]